MVFKVTDVCKSFGSLQALSNIRMRVDDAEIVSIIGPSGSGKTTLLRIIAGLEKPDNGKVVFEEVENQSSRVIMVFQDYVLFPHLNVFENVAFGLRARKTLTKGEIRNNVDEILEYFGIADIEIKYPAQISGGQRQRTAIARAMVLNPGVLLLDEPFANLDRNLKFDTAAFIRRTQKKFGVTTVTVTHDIEEAFLMSDKIGILLAGKLIQYDSVERVYFDPADMETAGFLGPVNSIDEELFNHLTIRCEQIPHGGVLLARAEGFELRKADNGEGVISSRLFTGRMILYDVHILDYTLRIYSLSDAFRPGDRVEVILNRCISSSKDFHYA